MGVLLRIVAVTIGLLSVFVPACASAQPADPFDLTLPVLAAPPHMNGELDDSWTGAAQVDVSYDFTFQRAGETTTAYVSEDATALDVAFVVKQSATSIATQTTNGSGVLSDDHVTVALWPQGTQGFAYDFSATPRGARYQTSTENTAYSPEWTAVGKLTPDGYVVTMRIPFDIMRAGGSTTWRAQFERSSIATGNTQVWEHAPAQNNVEQVAFAGTLQGVAAGRKAAVARPKPRVQVYGLGDIASPTIGGSTSRVGADVALPVTPTSSLLATFHPDYSDVEVDQQTITPSTFARQYTEVRPFFTQTAQNFNLHMFCENCAVTLYTPAIPTFGQGYAYEGTQGPVQFAAFDAIGFERHDSAETASYNISNAQRAVEVNLQNVQVNIPGITDTAATVDAGYTDEHTHLVAFVNTGTDRGTLVTNPGLGNNLEYGLGYIDQNTTTYIDFQDIGAQFNPLDGYVLQNDLDGYWLSYSHTFNFSKRSFLRDASILAYYSRYGNHFQQIAQDNTAEVFTFDARDLITWSLIGNSSGIRTVLDEYLPFNTSGFTLAYNKHSAAPTSVLYLEGAYYHGHLTTWNPSSTIRAGKRSLVTVAFDRNNYVPTVGSAGGGVDPVAVQLLETASYEYQFSHNASFDVGVRRIIGRNLPNSYQVPDLTGTPSPYFGQVNGPLPFDFVNASNVSFAFHLLRLQNEFYIAYGDPNSLTTTPGFIVKWIHYIGAQKGT